MNITEQLARQVLTIGAAARRAAVADWRGDYPNAAAPRDLLDWPLGEGCRSWVACIQGDRGTGKTVGMARLAIRTAGLIKEKKFGPGADDDSVRGVVRWVTIPELSLIACPFSGWDDKSTRWQAVVRELITARVLYIDDLSLAWSFTNEKHLVDGLIRIFTARHDAQRFTCFSTAVPPERLEEKAPTLVSRLREATIRWELTEPVRERAAIERGERSHED